MSTRRPTRRERRPGWSASVLCATLGASTGACPAHAAELRPLGSLEITLGGSMAALAAFGSLEHKTGESSGRGDLATDVEVDIEAALTDAATGLRYGAQIKLDGEADAQAAADETFVFVGGGFGQLRIGDDAGVAENMALGGFTVAVGSGGTDGDIIDTEAVNYVVSSDATKLVYYSPIVAGFQLGVSFAPSAESDGTDIASTDEGGLDDLLEAGLTYTTEAGELDIAASVVGGWAHADQAIATRGESGHGVFGGIRIGYEDLELAGGLGTAELAQVGRRWVNVGAAYEIEPVTLSIDYGQVLDATAPPNEARSRPRNLVIGAEAAIARGLAASVELSWFDDSRVDDETGGHDPDDRGVLGLARLAVDF